MGESLQQEQEGPGWALTLTDPVPEAFEFSPSDWPEKYFFWPISEEEQLGDTHVFLHEVVFLIERCSSVARSMGTFLRRASEKNKIINKRSRGNRKL